MTQKKKHTRAYTITYIACIAYTIVSNLVRSTARNRVRRARPTAARAKYDILVLGRQLCQPISSGSKMLRNFETPGIDWNKK